MNKIEKLMTCIVFLILSANIETAYAFDSPRIKCDFTFLLILIVSIVLIAISLKRTMTILLSKERNKLVRLIKWWVLVIIVIAICVSFPMVCRVSM
jgi:hypothetical protein